MAGGVRPSVEAAALALVSPFGCATGTFCREPGTICREPGTICRAADVVNKN
jgi:hypothetical protein